MAKNFIVGIFAVIVLSFAGCAQPSSPQGSAFTTTNCSGCTLPSTTTGTTTGATYSGNFVINESAASAPTGSPITLTPQPNGVSNAVYTWSQVSPSSGPWVTLADAGNGAITVSSSYAMTVQIQVVETSSTDSTLNIYTIVTLTFTGGTVGTTTGTTGTTTGHGNTPLTCTLAHPPATYYVGSSVYWTISTNTGEQVIITQFDPGEPGMVNTLPLNPPVTGRYSYAGQKNITMVVESAVRPGVFCNGGAALTDQIYINSLVYTYW